MPVDRRGALVVLCSVYLACLSFGEANLDLQIPSFSSSSPSSSSLSSLSSSPPSNPNAPTAPPPTRDLHVLSLVVRYHSYPRVTSPPPGRPSPPRPKGAPVKRRLRSTRPQGTSGPKIAALTSQPPAPRSPWTANPPPGHFLSTYPRAYLHLECDHLSIFVSNEACFWNTHLQHLLRPALRASVWGSTRVLGVSPKGSVGGGMHMLGLFEKWAGKKRPSF